MNQGSLKRKRIAVKEGQIAQHLRQQIVRGELPPGAQLPKRIELERQFSVSPLTLQRALSSLIEDGFVYAKTGQGTFVASHPPHLSRYGLIFPFHPNGQNPWSNYYTALNNEALSLQKADPNTLTIYYGLELPENRSECDKLIADVESHRLAGLVFASTPVNFRGTPLLDEPRIARVAVMRNPGFGIPQIRLDGDAFSTKAMDYLAGRGRHRVAVINSATMSLDWMESFRQAVAQRGMDTHPYWIQGVHTIGAEWARNVIHLMFNAPADQRPDALFISDDNLVPHATAGLLAAGVNVPEDVDVVVHANFPWPTPSVVPVKRLGFDARQVLRLCLQSIDRQRKLESVEQLTSVTPLFEEEIGASGD
jgi:DNA-binding LacI/PurR family transcriptional regulator